jgi:hypothetical protein
MDGRIQTSAGSIVVSASNAIVVLLLGSGSNRSGLLNLVLLMIWLLMHPRLLSMWVVVVVMPIHGGIR